jgi:hypothetical protein
LQQFETIMYICEFVENSKLWAHVQNNDESKHFVSDVS